MKEDKLITCIKCGSDAAYEISVSETVTNTSCYGCGFNSSTAMVEDSEFYNTQMEILPELYKELVYKDKETQSIWMPNYINLVDNGMVFANGSSKYNWKWAAVKAMDIPKDEQHKYPIPSKPGEFYERRMDMKTLKEFDHESGFIDSLDYIGVFG